MLKIHETPIRPSLVLFHHIHPVCTLLDNGTAFSPVVLHRHKNTQIYVKYKNSNPGGLWTVLIVAKHSGH